MFKKTFFVLSPSYHGATLLSKLLNAHPEVTTLGDTYPSNQFDQVCGCRERVSHCAFWQGVKRQVDARRYTKARFMLPQYPGDRGGWVGRLLFSDFTSFWATPSILRCLYSQALLRTFRDDFEDYLMAVYEQTPHPGAVFVDGLKFISRISALQAAGFPVDGIIHLYRDPVDFVGSSIRNTGRGGRLGLIEHTLRYRSYHARASQVALLAGKELVLTYESLSENIDSELSRLFDYLGVSPMTLNQLRPYFGQEWHFMGNASLFEFDGTLKPSHHFATYRRQAVNILSGRSR